MSNHKPYEPKNRDINSPEMLATEVQNFAAHLKEHNPSKTRLAIMLNGIASDNGESMEICSFIAGSPPDIAYALTGAIAAIVERDKKFGMVMILSILDVLGRTKGRPDLSVFDNLGGDSAKEVVDSIIASMKKSDGSIH